MRVSALRITKPQAPPPFPPVEGFEDVIETTLRHGYLYTDTEVLPKARNGHNDGYQREYEARLKQYAAEQAVRNKALALKEYEWNKPENVARRIAEAKAAHAAQKAKAEAFANAVRERVFFEEAIRILQEEEAWLKQEAADKAARIARKQAEKERIEAEVEAARAWWTTINPDFATQSYRPCRFDRHMHYGNVALLPHKGYWLPGPVRSALLAQLGF